MLLLPKFKPSHHTNVSNIHYLAVVLICMNVYRRFIVCFVDIGSVPNFGQHSYKGVDTFALILVGSIV
jgi:hypothetical protein